MKMIFRSAGVLIAAVTLGWATAPLGFETHYIDVGPSGNIVALAASPQEPGFFIVTSFNYAYNLYVNRVLKTDVAGHVVAKFDFPGTAPNAATVDKQGNLLLAGFTTDLIRFPATAQLVPKLAGSAAFILKIDPNLTGITAAVLLGGSTAFSLSSQPGLPDTAALAVTADIAGNVYVTGTTSATDFPVSPGAYRTAPPESLSTFSFITKLTPDLAGLVYSTYFGSDSSGAAEQPIAITAGRSIAVDSAGRATVGGSSNGDSIVSGSGGSLPQTPYPFVARFSPDGTSLDAYQNFGKLHDTTPGQGIVALALDVSGNTLAAGDAGSASLGTPGGIPPAPIFTGFNAGYVAKLDSSLNLVYGTLIGSNSVVNFQASPTIRGLELDPQGNIWITAVSEIRSLPGGDPINGSSGLTPYIAEISADGSSLLDLLLTPVGGLGMAESAGGSLAVLGSPDSYLLSTPSAQGGPFIVTSSANNVSSGTVAPGELVSFYGNGIGPAAGFAGQVVNGVFTNSLNGYQVLFNDIPAPLFYLGPNQINTVVPEEIAFLLPGASHPSVTVRVAGPNGMTNLPSVFVVPSNPQIFVTTQRVNNVNPTLYAAALNEDGSVNSAANPAAPESIVTIWATGLGYEDAEDGSIIQHPIGAGPVSVVTPVGSAAVLYGSDAPAAVLGLTQINLKLPTSGYLAVQTSSATSIYVEIYVEQQ